MQEEDVEELSLPKQDVCDLGAGNVVSDHMGKVYVGCLDNGVQE